MSQPPDRDGHGVDAAGGPVIDPTANVLSLVEAAIKRIDDLFEAGVKRLDERIGAEADKSTALRAQRDLYEARIDNMQADYQKQIASILERQTDKSASVLADAVNKATERLAVVEKNQYQTGGQASVRDPAIADAISKMTSTLENLSRTGNKTEGKSEGFSQIGAIVLGVCTVIATIIAAAAFVATRS
jgi:hypothetical protein